MNLVKKICWLIAKYIMRTIYFVTVALLSGIILAGVVGVVLLSILIGDEFGVTPFFVALFFGAFILSGTVGYLYEKFSANYWNRMGKYGFLNSGESMVEPFDAKKFFEFVPKS